MNIKRMIMICLLGTVLRTLYAQTQHYEFFYFNIQSEAKSYVFRVKVFPISFAHTVEQKGCKKGADDYECVLFGATQDNVRETKPKIDPDTGEQVFVTDPKTGKKTRPILAADTIGTKVMTSGMKMNQSFMLQVSVHEYNKQKPDFYDRAKTIKEAKYSIKPGPGSHSMNLNLNYNKITGISLDLKGGEYKKL